MPAPLLLHIFPSFDIGGAQSRFVTLANHFGRALRHVIVSVNGGYECAERLAPGLDVVLKHYPARKGHTLGNRRMFRRALREIQPDILVTHNWGSIEWA